MGKNAARAAASAIERDTWGAGAPGNVKEACPGACRKIYRIHPAVGVARVGDSPWQFFIGAEVDTFRGPEKVCELFADPAKGYSEKLVSSTVDKTRFKDKKYPGAKIRRQAARFRIYEYRELKSPAGAWGWAREITSDDAEITWTVEVANLKASFQNFNGPNMSTARPGAKKKIVPGKKTLTIQHGFDPLSAKKKHKFKRETLEDPGSASTHKYLGEILHDNKGRLIVLGGRGAADGPADPTNYANNKDWTDDVSDGPITASIKFPGQPPVEADPKDGGAWVCVGPPDFAPELSNITSLYDTMLDVATRVRQKDALAPQAPENEVLWTLHGIQDRAKGTFEPTFESDLLRLFEATYQVNTVYKPANPPMKHPAVFKLSRQTKLDDANEEPADVAARKAPRAHIRYKVFNTLRPWDEDKKRDPGDGTGATNALVLTSTDPVVSAPVVGAIDARAEKAPSLPSKDKSKYEDTYLPYRWTMPMLWGDSDTDNEAVRNAVTELQYRVVKQWCRGKFKDTAAQEPSFETIRRSGLLTPGGLDRSALDRCVGGPFFPGIEVSWLARSTEIYSAPLRMKVGHAMVGEINLGKFKSVGVPAVKPTVGPGFFSQQMAQPWHADFLACARFAGKIGWWPAQRPDDVVRGGAPADPNAMTDSEPAQAADWKVTTFKPSGVAELAKIMRNVTITTVGTEAAAGPTEAVVKGKDDAGNPVGPDKIPLASVAGTSAGELLFASISEVAFNGVTKPANTRAKLAIGLKKSPPTVAAHEPTRIEGPTTVANVPRTISAIDPKVTTDLAKLPRFIRFTVSGTHPEEAPAKVTVEGTAPKGTPLTETVVLPRKAGFRDTSSKFKSITKITIDKGQQTLLADLRISIGIGSASGAMEVWADNVASFKEMTQKWSRLGFVFGGVEVERDPTL